jgi:hypothetical protein
MFVADAKNGNIYHFKLNSQRTGLLLPQGPIADGIANTNDILDQIVFGRGFGGITDIKVNPYMRTTCIFLRLMEQYIE